eukprot:symbB.v1.2.013487.t1/scaffold957.1/size148979/5
MWDNKKFDWWFDDTNLQKHSGRFREKSFDVPAEMKRIATGSWRKGSIPMPRTFHPTGRAYSLSRPEGPFVVNG